MQSHPGQRSCRGISPFRYQSPEWPIAHEIQSEVEVGWATWSWVGEASLFLRRLMPVLKRYDVLEGLEGKGSALQPPDCPASKEQLRSYGLELGR